ncbi:hypothetical protein, partial [Mycolicibacterium mageritense]|uniref:hypothetical protein n=1 Tax=Mycolicibacterium mageritense TaxID=53462 RepID=UPI001E3D6787
SVLIAHATRSVTGAGGTKEEIGSGPSAARSITDENGTICTVKALRNIAAVASALADVAELIGHPA